MSAYQCEGFVKEVKIVKEGVSFTLEPAAPYLFEKKEEDGKTRRCVMFVERTDKDATALIFEEDHYFSFAKAQDNLAEEAKPRTVIDSPIDATCIDLDGLLMLKANRMKLRIEVKVDVKVERALIVL